MDSVFARFVAGGGDDAALIGTSADDNWFTAQIGRSRSSTETKKASMSTWRIFATDGAERSSASACNARNRARSGMRLAYAGKVPPTT